MVKYLADCHKLFSFLLRSVIFA